MRELNGYRIGQILYESERTIVYRGERIADDLPVVLKWLREDLPSQKQLARLNREFELTGQFDSDRIIRVLALEHIGHSRVLVLEDFEAVTLAHVLKSGPMEIGSFLKIALQIVEALREIHGQHVIHRDICPSNILINTESDVVKISDFDSASKLSQEQLPIRRPDLLQGSLPYMSPEQTGRTDLTLDYRTDFYSLGVTFYEMLSGRVPFVSDDPMEIIHSHIARIPDPVSDIRNEVPDVVSVIISRLLAKAPVDRYQSSRGLHADIAGCLEQLKSYGSIRTFTPGMHDISERLLLSDRMYGREQELEFLQDAFNRVNRGAKEVLLVHGDSGVGKSTLVNTLKRSIAGKRGYFISGTFDQIQRSTPYSALIEAYSDLIRQLLSEGEESLLLWKDRMIESLGPNGRVITDVIPEVELIVGPQPPLQQLPGFQSRNRFQDVFRKFTSIFTLDRRPFIVFLDNLQWSDPASLEIVEYLLRDPDANNILIIAAYRDRELGGTPALHSAIRRIRESPVPLRELHVEPLEQTNIHALLTDSLGSMEEKIGEFAELVQEKTNGNPFFVRQFLISLYDEGLLQIDYGAGHWTWDSEEIRRSEITPNVADLLAEKIRMLSTDCRKALRWASFIGNKFDLHLLAQILDVSDETTAGLLWEALDAGLILPQGETRTFVREDTARNQPALLSGDFYMGYRFAHDRIQQAAYELTAADRRSEYHAKIGMLMLRNMENAESGEELFDVVSHLNSAGDELLSKVERLQLAGLNLMAGNRARESSAFEPALSYYTNGLAHIGQKQLAENQTLHFELGMGQAECRYLLGNFTGAEELYVSILDVAKNAEERARVYTARCILLTNTGKYRQTIELVILGLQQLGLDMEETGKSTQAINRIDETGSGFLEMETDRLLELSVMTDSRMLHAMALLNSAGAAAYLSDHSFYVSLCLKMVHISMEHGNTNHSSYAYSGVGLILGSRLGNYESGYRYGELAIEVARSFNDKNALCEALEMMGGFINHWKRHARSNIEYLRQAYDAGIESGNFIFAGYSLLLSSYALAFCGVQLDEFENRLVEYLAFLKRTGERNGILTLRMLQQTVRNLRGETITTGTLDDGHYSEQVELRAMEAATTAIPRLGYHVNKLKLHCLHGRFEDALDAVDRARPLLDASMAMIYTAEFNFFESLSLAATAGSTPDESRLTRISRNQEHMKNWMENCPENFLDKYLLVEAELAALQGELRTASSLYDRAIEAARTNGFMHMEALANERAALFYSAQDRDEIARQHVLEARYAYLAWGARAKVASLEDQFSNLIDTPARRERGFSEGGQPVPGPSLDLGTVLKASQAISVELVLSDLLTRMMRIIIENAGAKTGFLLMQKDGKWFIEAMLDAQNEEEEVLTSIPLENSNRISTAVVHIVARTREPLVLQDASTQKEFAHDEFIAAHAIKSLLCMPLLSQGTLSGILYLENNLTANAFTPERLEVLNLLSAQTAISLRNATLYKELEDALVIARQVEESKREAEIKRREAEVERKKNEEIQEAYEKLRITQEQLVHAEKMASLGELTSGIAHEFSNPLNFVINFADLTVELLEDMQSEILESSEKKEEQGNEEIIGSIQDGLGDALTNVRRIHDHGKRATGIVKSMLLHSRKKAGEREPVLINQLLEEYVNLAFHSERARNPDAAVDIERDYDENVGEVVAVPQELSRVFLNLLNNALYVVSQKTESAGADYSPVVKVGTKRLDGEVEIRIEDNGDGIPEKIRARIFEPFFTTKPAGSGTGLGLSMSYEIIVQGHRGDLRVENNPSGGATFIILLPE